MVEKECPICLEVKPIEHFLTNKGREKRGCNKCTYIPGTKNSDAVPFGYTFRDWERTKRIKKFLTDEE